VRAAVAERSVPLAFVLPSGRVVTGTSAEPATGYGWDSAILTPFTLRSGHAPLGSNQLVVGAGLARSARLELGGQVRLAGRASPPFTVVGIAAAPRGDPAGNWAVFFSGPEITLLYGHPGQADLVGVVATAGTSPAALAARVRAATAGDHLTVLTGNGLGAAENLAADSELSDLASFGGTGVIFVLVSLFVVASTVALSIAERARTTALLRAAGATPGQARRMVMAELGALGLLAGTSPGARPAAFSKEISALSASYPGLRVVSRGVANAQDELAGTQTSDANDLLDALVGLLAAVALVTTLVMTTLAGRDEPMLLLRVGATVRQLAATAAWEAAAVTLAGAVLGAGAASAAVVGIAKALTGSWAPSIPAGSLAVIAGLVVALAGIATVVPTVLALRAGRRR
jgi:hypothetical protein